MGRHRKITRNKFKVAYDKGKNMPEIANTLKVSIPTAYKYAHKYNYPIKSKDSDKLSLDIFKAYKGSTTMEQLAVDFDLTRQAVRYHLWKVIRALNKKKPEQLEWPLPQKLGHLKVLHLLDEQPDLFDYPDKIAALINLRRPVVEEYLTHAFKKRTEKRSL